MTPTQREAALRLAEGPRTSGELWARAIISLLRELLAAPETWSVEECDRVMKTLRYVQGIAERGEGRKMRDDETLEAFVLGYVKRLELAAEPVQSSDADAELRHATLSAEPVQKPVAWIHRAQYLLAHAENSPPADKMLENGWEPLYAAPQQRRPPSDEFVSRVVRSVQPNLDVRCKAWTEQFDECKHWLDAAHGITGEPT